MAIATITAASIAAAQPVRLVPTVSQPVRVAWNDWLEQLLVHETSLIESAAEAGVEIAAATSPIGSIAVSLIGPTIVKQFVDQGLTMIEGMLSNPALAITIDKPNYLEAYVINVINTQAPNLAIKLGDGLAPMVKAAIAKVTPPPVVIPSHPVGTAGTKPTGIIG